MKRVVSLTLVLVIAIAFTFSAQSKPVKAQEEVCITSSIPDARVRGSGDTGIIGIMPQNTIFHAEVTESGDWYYVPDLNGFVAKFDTHGNRAWWIQEVSCDSAAPQSPTSSGQNFQFETERCFQINNVSVNQRSGPGTNFSISGNLSFGAQFNGSLAIGTQWVRRSDNGGWYYQPLLTDCNGQGVAQASTGASNNTNTGGWIQEEGVFFKNRPNNYNPASIFDLFQILGGRVSPVQSTCGLELPLFVQFGTHAEMLALWPNAGSNTVGFAGYGVWDGNMLNMDTTGLNCGQVVRVVFLQVGRSEAATWATFAHELSHLLGAAHGTAAHSAVSDRDETIAGLSDAYWIDDQVERAYNGNCGGDPSELCVTVAQLVFGH